MVDWLCGDNEKNQSRLICYLKLYITASLSQSRILHDQGVVWPFTFGWMVFKSSVKHQQLNPARLDTSVCSGLIAVCVSRDTVIRVRPTADQVTDVFWLCL